MRKSGGETEEGLQKYRTTRRHDDGTTGQRDNETAEGGEPADVGADEEDYRPAAGRALRDGRGREKWKAGSRKRKWKGGGQRTEVRG